MKNFLYKEIKLITNPLNWIFLLFLTMLLIPTYPCYVPFFYLCLSVFFMFNNAEINRDMDYSLILPIRKKDIVKSRCILVFFYQILGLILSIPFVFLRVTENQAGIDLNVAFFGLIMICLSIFNFVFITGFYKKGEKPGLPFLASSILYFVVYIVFEIPIWMKSVFNVEYFIIMDNTDATSQIKQLPILFIGIMFYVLTWFLTYKVSAKRFEKVDL